MKKNVLIFCLSLFLIVFNQEGKCEQEFQIHNGSREQKLLLNEVLKSIFPQMDPWFQSFAKNLPYVIANTQENKFAEQFLLVGPANDPIYKKGDQKFFNPNLPLKHPEQGSIRILVTRKALQAMAIFREFRRRQPYWAAMANAQQAFWQAHFVFELNYIAHFLEESFTGGLRGISDCAQGVCREDLTRETVELNQNLREQSLTLLWEILKPHLKSLSLFADRLREFERKNSRAYQYGGDYSVLGHSNYYPLADHDLKNIDSARILEAHGFPYADEIWFDGQWVPALIALRLIEINKYISFKRERTQVISFHAEVERLQNEWLRFSQKDPERNKLYGLDPRFLNYFPYLLEVQKRFINELNLFHNWEASLGLKTATQSH